jgi:uncharacterized protein YdeI (YjbR/CyaY-like superfamily)
MSPSPKRNVLASLAQVYVADRAAWRQWLAANHARSPGIWLVFDKKSSRADRLAYADAVEEALCYGWIDSTLRTLDDARYVQLMTPRKPTSNWSRTNKERIERLIALGLMAEPGLASIERAKANGSWRSLDAVEALVMPDDLSAALAAAPGAADKFAAFSPSARKGYLHWINNAVRPETRAHRVSEVVRHAVANRKSRFLEPTSVARTVKQDARLAKTGARAVNASRRSAKKKSATSAKRAASAKRAVTTKRRKQQ